MVFHWSFSDSKSPQVSKTLLSILAVFNIAVVWMVSTRLPTSKSSRPFNNSSVTVSKAPITISTIVTFMFHSFYKSLARSKYLSFFSYSFSFILWSVRGFRIKVVFFFLIHSRMLAFSWHLLCCRANLSWMNVNFFKTRIHVCHHGLVFTFGC